MGQAIIHHCGTVWIQKGNQTGHCSKCHRTFDSTQAFDAHQTVCATGVTCHDPASLVREDGSPRFKRRKGTAHGADAGTVYWSMMPTPKQQAWLDAKR